MIEYDKRHIVGYDKLGTGKFYVGTGHEILPPQLLEEKKLSPKITEKELQKILDRMDMTRFSQEVMEKVIPQTEAYRRAKAKSRENAHNVFL